MRPNQACGFVGFPDALRGDARAWWESYLRLVLERDLPRYGVRADPLFMRRLLTMLAHQHGGLLNASALGGSLGVSHHTLLRHLDVLESIDLLRRLPPYLRNVGKRLTKAPKVYLRDTGLLHHLLNISTADELASHPSRGASWEGFVTRDVLRRERLLHPSTQAFFWRTAAGAEIDLVLDRGSERIAVEIKAVAATTRALCASCARRCRMWTQRAAGSLIRRRVWNGSGNGSDGPDLLRSFRVRRRTVALPMRNQSVVRFHKRAWAVRPACINVGSGDKGSVDLRLAKVTAQAPSPRRHVPELEEDSPDCG